MTQSTIFEAIQKIIPVYLYDKYQHLSFGEMAEIEELSDYADELRRAEKDWFLSNE